MNARPPRPILAAVNAAAWLADRALTHLAPSAPRHVLEAENHRLRASLRDAEWTRRSLSADVDALTRIVSDLAEQLARATNHPSVFVRPAPLPEVTTQGGIVYPFRGAGV